MVTILELFNLVGTLIVAAVAYRRRHRYVSRNALSATFVFVAFLLLLRLCHFLTQWGVDPGTAREIQGAVGTMMTTSLVLVFIASPPGTADAEIVVNMRRSIATKAPQVSSIDDTVSAKAQGELCSTTP